MFPTCQLRAGFLYLLVLLVIPLAQQANASSWTGVLRDASRSPVDTAKIEIRTVNGHPIRGATTAADGTFLISGITAGAYVDHYRDTVCKFDQHEWRDHASFCSADRSRDYAQ